MSLRSCGTFLLRSHLLSDTRRRRVQRFPRQFVRKATKLKTRNMLLCSVATLSIGTHAQVAMNYLAMKMPEFEKVSERWGSNICEVPSAKADSTNCAAELAGLFQIAQEELQKRVGDSDWATSMDFYNEKAAAACEMRFSASSHVKCKRRANIWFRILRREYGDGPAQTAAAPPSAKSSVDFGSASNTPSGTRTATGARSDRGTPDGTSELERYKGIGAPPPGYITKKNDSSPPKTTSGVSAPPSPPSATGSTQTARKVGEQLDPSCVKVTHNGLGTNSYSATISNSCGRRVDVWGGIMFNGEPVEWVWIAAQFADGTQPRLSLNAGQTITTPSGSMRWPGTFGWVVKGVRLAN